MAWVRKGGSSSEWVCLHTPIHFVTGLHVTKVLLIGILFTVGPLAMEGEASPNHGDRLGRGGSSDK
eukprot:3291028-Amphidinium_carterae.1